MRTKSGPQTKITKLYSRLLTLIAREVDAIDKLSKYGAKLAVAPARDLINYTKLLKDLKEAADKMQAEKQEKAKQEEKTMSAEQLEKLLEAGTGAGPSIPPTVSHPSPTPFKQLGSLADWAKASGKQDKP